MQDNKPLFSHHADATLERVRATYAERGGQYGDTLRDCQWLTMKAVARQFGCELPEAGLIAIGIAALVDIKHQRMQGGYKDDNLVDGMAYAAVLANAVKERLEGKGDFTAEDVKELCGSCTRNKEAGYDFLCCECEKAQPPSNTIKGICPDCHYADCPLEASPCQECDENFSQFVERGKVGKCEEKLWVTGEPSCYTCIHAREPLDAEPCRECFANIDHPNYFPVLEESK